MENTSLPVKKEIKNKYNVFFSVLFGSVAGFINGIFGGGGGMIVVPFLLKIFKYNEKVAHATSMLIILPISIVSGLLYLKYSAIDLKPFSIVSFGVVSGGIIGAVALKKLNSDFLYNLFVFLMLFMGLKMFLK